MGLRSHSGLSFTCLVIQSRTEQFNAVSCRLYSLLLLPEEEEVQLREEPLVCCLPTTSSQGLEEEAGPLNVRPERRERM